MDTNKKPIDVSKLTPEQYQLEINKFNTQGQTPVNTAIPPVITSDMLKPQPELKLPEKAVPAPSPILAEADALVQTSLEKQAADAKKTQDTNVSDITQLMEAIGGVEGKRGQYQEEAGVFTNQDAIKEIDDQLLVQSRALKAKNEEIRRNPQLTQSMAARLMNEEERKAASTTADLMVTRSLLNRDVDRAMEIANRKVEAELAPLKAKLDEKKFVFDNNKDWISTLQRTALETAIKKDEREITKKEDIQKKNEEMYIQASLYEAPADVLSKARKAINEGKDNTEVAEIIGKYRLDPIERAIKQAQLAKYNQDLTQSSIEFSERNGVATGGVGVNATNPAYTNAINTILGSAKFSKDQAKAVKTAIENGEDPLAVIKNNAKNIMGQTLATDLDKAETAKAQLEAIDRSLKKYYANGGDTGIFKGNYEKTLNKLGETKDPKLVGIATEIALAMQAYRLAVTGTAASVQEDARIDNVFPGITSGQVLNNARTQATIRSFDTKIDQAYRNTLGSNYDALKKSAPQEIPKLTSDEFAEVIIPTPTKKSLFSVFNKKFR